MKKTVILFLAVGTLLLCACTSAPPPLSTQGEVPKPSETKAQTPPEAPPVTTQGTTDELTDRNDYFARLIARYHPNFKSTLSHFLPTDAYYDSFFEKESASGTLDCVLNTFGPPWTITQKGTTVELCYLLSAKPLEHTEQEVLRLRMEEREGSLVIKEMEKTYEWIDLPQENELTPNPSPERNDLLTSLAAQYAPQYDGSQITVDTFFRRYCDNWEKSEAPINFGEVVDTLDAPWHAWEQDGTVRLLYRGQNVPDFTFIFRPTEDDLLLEEIQTLYVPRDDLTPEMLAQLKVGESTRKDVNTLLGVPTTIGSGIIVYRYYLTDGGVVKVDYDSQHVLTQLEIVYPT